MRRLWKWLWQRVSNSIDALAAWSETPKGDLVRWTISVGLIAYSIGAGHPVG